MIPFAAAKRMYLERYNLERTPHPKGLIFPYKEDCSFVEVDVPVDLITAWPKDKDTVKDLQKKLSREGELDPVWLIFGRDFPERPFVPFWNRKFQVMDGNHRVGAATELGKETILAYMPKHHYEFWRG